MDRTKIETLLGTVRELRNAASKLEQELLVLLTEEASASTAGSDESAFGEWLTLAEMGEWLRVSRSTAYKMIHDEDIPIYRVGRSIRVKRQDVERWLASNRWDYWRA